MRDITTQLYLNQIRGFDLLDGREEEAVLFGRLQVAREAYAQMTAMVGGDHIEPIPAAITEAIDLGNAARKRIFEGNLPLVVDQSKRYPRPIGVAQLDLIQEGNISLWRAVDAFDATQGAKFSTFAVPRIRARMQYFLHTKGQLVGNPNARRRGSDEYNPALDELHEKRFGVMVYLDELLKTEEDTLETKGDRVPDPTADTFPDQVEMQAVPRRKIGAQLLSILPEQQQSLLVQSAGAYGEPKTHAELAIELGISESIAGRRINLAKARLQHPSNAPLVEILPVDPRGEDIIWQADAACRGLDDQMFFPERGQSTKRARRVCGACPVREDCLEWSIERKIKFGIWGGVSENQREEIRKQRASTTEPTVAE